MVLGSRGLSRADPRRFALGVLNVAFGGGSLAAVPGGAGEAGPGLLDLLLRRPVHRDGLVLGLPEAAPKRIHEVLAIVRDELERVVAEG